MGAIVGGLYSSGYSPAELRTLAETIDWAGIFDDSVPRQDLSYRRKQDDSNFLTKARIGIRDGSIRSPQGLIQGQDLPINSVSCWKHAHRSAISINCRYSGWGNAEVETGDPSLPDQDVDIRDLIARVDIDRLDQLSFPQDRYRVSMSYRRSLDSLGATADYGIINASGLTAHSFGSNTVIATLDAQYTGEGTNSVESRALLGGLFNLSGLERNEISGEHSFLGRLGYFRNISGANEGFLNLPIYIGTTAEAGQVYDSQDAFQNLENITFAGSAWLGVDTPIGPLYMAYGRAEGGRQSAYLFLGRSF